VEMFAQVHCLDPDTFVRDAAKMARGTVLSDVPPSLSALVHFLLNRGFAGFAALGTSQRERGTVAGCQFGGKKEGNELFRVMQLQSTNLSAGDVHVMGSLYQY